MYKILPIILIGLFFHQGAQSQCNAAFYFTVSGATVQVHAADSTPLKYHNWSFGDGSHGWGSYVAHTYATTGTYNILHVLIDSVSGCRDTAIQQVTINVPVSCHASFAFTPDSIHPHYYHYYSTSTATGGSIQSYQWKVDGVVLSTASTLNWADSSGSHVICLRIQTTAGCVSTTCDSVITSDTTNSCHLTAGFSTTVSPANPLSVSFYPTPASPAYTYSWSFGDGQSSSLQSPTHLYSAPGNYLVVFFVTDTIGHCFDSTFRYVYVQGPPVDSCTLTANFTSTVSSGNPMLVNFAATPSGPTWTYSWSFGDGTYSSLPSPAHLYSTPGTYFVTLIVSDSVGHCSDSAFRNVTVTRRADSCTVSFTHTVNPSQPNQVSFTAVSSDSAVSYFWFVTPCDTLTGPFPDSVVFTTPGFTYTFNTPGCYRICLSLLTRSGCRKYYCDTVQIQNNAGARLIASYPNPATGSDVNIGLSLERSEKVKVSVYNSFGRLVYTIERPYASGQNKIDIPVSKLQRGTYYVDIQYGNTRKRSVFQKL